LIDKILRKSFALPRLALGEAIFSIRSIEFSPCVFARA
jgi:hypothetical protein